jgi:hypothetical protein
MQHVALRCGIRLPAPPLATPTTRSLACKAGGRGMGGGAREAEEVLSQVVARRLGRAGRQAPPLMHDELPPRPQQHVLAPLPDVTPPHLSLS